MFIQKGLWVQKMNRQDACIVINGNDTPDLKLNTQEMTPIIIEDSGDACVCVNGF